jgi:hypothetical protein
MSDLIQIPVKEYELMKEEISLLKNNTLLEKLNRLVEILYEEKYGLYLGDDTADLTEASIQNTWPQEKSVWDDV